MTTEYNSDLDRLWARALTDQQLASETDRIAAIIDAGFGEGGGSPGEWFYERHDELTLEASRRR